MLPEVAHSNPGFVNDAIAVNTGRGTVHGDIGAFSTAIKVTGFAYLIGGLLFGIALYRARVLPRWAAALLAVGGLVSAALVVMPDAFYRLLAFPNGIAMIALGYSLWRVARADAVTGETEADTRVASTAGVRMSHPPAATAQRLQRPRKGWWVPPALLALAFIPVLGGGGRLVELLGGPEVLPSDARFVASPVPLIVHIVSAVVYAVLGAFQFSARLRRRHPGWHRRAGRLLVVLGLAVAFSGLWMTLAYPQKEGTGDLLWVTRLLVSSGMGAAVILGLVAIRNRDIARHRAWMTRAYALALGAGTQAFTVGFGEALFGTGVVNHDLMMAAAWVINLAVAEWVIRRPAVRRARRARATLVGAS